MENVLVPQRKDQFHINLFFFLTCLPLNSPWLKESLFQCQWLVADSSKQPDPQNFAAVVSVELTIQENSPTGECEHWKMSCALCVQDWTAWRTGRREPGLGSSAPALVTRLGMWAMWSTSGPRWLNLHWPVSDPERRKPSYAEAQLSAQTHV